MKQAKEPQTSESTTAKADTEKTMVQIDEVLQSFDVLSSRGEKHLFRYAYLYFLGFFLLYMVFMIAGGVLLGYTNNSNFVRLTGTKFITYVTAIGESNLLFFVWISLVLWIFNAWREHVPHFLRDVFERRRIDVPVGDVNIHYLAFLKHYHDTLRSPRRYLLIGGLPAIYFLIRLYIGVKIGFFAVIGNTIFWSGMGFLGSLITFGVMYCLGIIMWALSVSGWHIRKLSRAFEFRIEAAHPDHCGGLKALGNFCFDSVSPLFIGLVFYIGYMVAASVLLRDVTIAATSWVAYIGFIVFIVILYIFPVAILTFFLPLWNIHTKMLKAREKEEETYAANIAALREQMQSLLSSNQLEEAKSLKEKKELLEAEYIPYPTWPFNVKTKFFSTLLGASGSFVLGVLTAIQQPLAQYLLKRIGL